jgi:DNA-binding SARP family transcriptional activator
MESVHITLFGHITVAHSAGAEPSQLPRSTQAFLAYLLLHHQLVTRETLMDTFWQNCRPDRARSSLTTAIWRLRQLLEPEPIPPGTFLLTKNSGEVGFNWASPHWLDIETFEEQLVPLLQIPLSQLSETEVGTLTRILALYRGELLEGIYDDWALFERERLRVLYLNGLMRLMSCHTTRNNFDQAIDYGQKILRHDPLREEIHRNLMRLYLGNGQRGLAIRQYSLCREVLIEQLGIEPLEETQSLYLRIIESPSIDYAPPAPPLDSGCLPTNDSHRQEIAHLTYELQLVKHSLEKTTQALEKLTKSLNRLTSGSAGRSSLPSEPKERP